MEITLERLRDGMIYLGVLIMLADIIYYISFVYQMTDVVSGRSRRQILLRDMGLILLFFFLIGYICIGITGTGDILMGAILFGGSVFVAIVQKFMFQMIAEVKKKSIEISQVLISVIEARDPNLNGHSRYVQNLTMLIYEYLPNKMKKNLNPVSLAYAALMHDVGKLGVPEKVLNKPAKLDGSEWEIMREHPKIALRILQPIKSFASIQEWILYHHERMDGNGYYQIPGEQIPLAARIIAVADTYSTITMRRVYKEPCSYEAAIDIIRECAGTQLDVKLVNLFCKIPKDEVESCMPEIEEIQ